MKVVANKSFFKSIENLDSFKNKWYSVREWFKYHFNKNNFKIIKTVLKGYPWDASFLYELEKVKIEEMIAYHEKHKRYVGVENDIRDMKICLNLIDIFTEKKSLFHYDGEIKYIPIEGSEDVEVDTSGLTYHCDVKVNTQNAARFVPHGKNNSYIDYWKEHPHEIYILKAKALYHKIRLERDFEWWD